jgi:hypothetical protein
MEDEEQIQLPVAPAAPAVPVNNSVKLPAFWPANITAWFASVECIFELRNITSQRARYFNVLAALPETTVVLIADLIGRVRYQPTRLTGSWRDLLLPISLRTSSVWRSFGLTCHGSAETF